MNYLIELQLRSRTKVLTSYVFHQDVLRPILPQNLAYQGTHCYAPHELEGWPPDWSLIQEFPPFQGLLLGSSGWSVPLCLHTTTCSMSRLTEGQHASIPRYTLSRGWCPYQVLFCLVKTYTFLHILWPRHHIYVRSLLQMLLACDVISSVYV